MFHDIVIATRGPKEQNTQKLENVLMKLERDEGLKASRKKLNFNHIETVWLGQNTPKTK